MMRSAAVCVLIGVLVVGASAEVKKTDVDLKASDGAVLKGTYFSPGRPGPAVLLLHQCNMDRSSWDGLANDLATAGIHVLTLNFRGYGDSGDKPADPAARRTQTQQQWPGDVDTAYSFLIGQAGVDRSSVAAGGASCGVTQAVSLASRHKEVTALVLLSPPPGDFGKAYIAETPALAIFGAAAENDAFVPTAAQSITEAREVSKNPRTTTKIYPGSEHGVPMFTKNPELEPMIVSWLKTQLLSKRR
jgi:dienelactone hydrolase